jgi:ribulose 1,5-bisphosphate synthetase/thiazole synthase
VADDLLQDVGVDLRGEVDMKLKVKRAAIAAATLALAVVAFGAAVKFR